MHTDNAQRPAILIAVIDAQYTFHVGVEAWLAGMTPPIKIEGNYTDAAEFVTTHHTISAVGSS